MNFAALLSMNVYSLEERHLGTYRKPKDTTMAWGARRAKADAKYKAAFDGKELTSPEVAAKLGYQRMSALCGLYALEKRGLVERVGLRERTNGHGKPPIIWKWCGD